VIVFLYSIDVWLRLENEGVVDGEKRMKGKG
jgi:hypothetical protein